MYQKTGFEIVGENEEEYIMLCRLNQAYIVFFLTKIGYIYLQFWLIDN